MDVEHAQMRFLLEGEALLHVISIALRHVCTPFTSLHALDARIE